jgi:hypothetical protein
MSRERLPNRRRGVTASLQWPPSSGQPIDICGGFAPDGRLLEVFVKNGGKIGSERNEILDDAAVLISRLLQFGDRLSDIASGLGRLPDGGASSVVGAVVDELARLEAEATPQ